MRKSTRFVVVLLLAGCLASCDRGLSGLFRSYSMADLEALTDSSYRINPPLIRQYIAQLAAADADKQPSDEAAKHYYRNGKRLIWVGFIGLNQHSDTLLSRLKAVSSMGFRPEAFGTTALERDLQRLQTLDFDTTDNDVNHLLARLEYRFTKAYFRFATGQRFGFTNPRYLLNHLDKNLQDSTGRSFRRQFDLPLEEPTPAFYATAAGKVRSDSLEEFLNEVQPTDILYRRLAQRLQSDTLSAAHRNKILANMERCRWRIKDDPRLEERYVIVNIPAFMLSAVDKESVTTMKIGCGITATKTPLLTSKIKRIDLNPQWIIPPSIIKGEVSHHAGDSAWFARHRYFIREKKTGELLDPRAVSRAMLLSGAYTVAQEGGTGNSLGRIIFRFDNAFSVYIHHTSSPGFFSRDIRSVSHGCIRVEQPYELAQFMLGAENKELLNKISYSMSADVSTLGAVARSRGITPDPSIDKKKLVSNIAVTPQVPLYVAYYTIYSPSASPTENSSLANFPDVYGYDRVLCGSLAAQRFIPSH